VNEGALGLGLTRVPIARRESDEPQYKWGVGENDLHPAHPNPQRPTRGRIALLPLALLLERARVDAVLARAHLEVEDARVLEPAREVFHEDEEFLAGEGVVARVGHAGGHGWAGGYEWNGGIERATCADAGGAAAGSRPCRHPSPRRSRVRMSRIERGDNRPGAGIRTGQRCRPRK
jgi:hypothetical protein